MQIRFLKFSELSSAFIPVRINKIKVFVLTGIIFTVQSVTLPVQKGMPLTLSSGCDPEN